MKKWLGILLTASLASCGGESTTTPANLLVTNDFESIDGWVNDAAISSLTKEKAHSGIYSVAVRPGIDYSLGYSNPLGKMSTTRPEKLKLTAWVFVPTAEAIADLVLEVRDPAVATPQLWDGIVLSKEVKKLNEWQQIEKIITLPANAKATSLLKMYLWRANSNQPVYLDDVTLSLANDTK